MSEKLEGEQSSIDPASQGSSNFPNSTPPSGESAPAKPLYPSTNSNPTLVTAAADSQVEKITTSRATVRKGRPGKTFWREVLETVLLTIIVFFVVKGIIANFRIQGSSMEPSFHNNQLVLVNKAAYFHINVSAWTKFLPWTTSNPADDKTQHEIWPLGGPHRGDVLIFQPPDVQDEDYIKRVVGLPGDKVEVKGNKVYVNDTPLTEPYIKEPPYGVYAPTVVPDNNLFVMGDNRNASRDSRSFGMLPIDLIVGKAMLIYWPTGDKWGPVPDVSYK